MINEIENQLGYPLLLRSQGGNNGGGSELTPMGKQFLEAFQMMQAEIREESQKIFERYFPDGRLHDRDSIESLACGATVKGKENA